MKQKGGNNKLAWLLIIFFVLAAVFFVVDANGLSGRSFAISLPVFFLGVLTFIPARLNNIWLPLGLVLSSIGDFMGSEKIFLAQVGFFALAHVSYIIFFIKGGWFRPSSLVMTIAIAVLAVVLGIKIMPGVGSSIEWWFILCYILVIALMAMSATFWKGKARWGYIAGALLFMFSDALIAWNMYVSPISSRFPWVMVTYYAAQFMFAATYLLSAPARKTH